MHLNVANDLQTKGGDFTGVTNAMAIPCVAVYCFIRLDLENKSHFYYLNMQPLSFDDSVT